MLSPEDSKYSQNKMTMNFSNLIYNFTFDPTNTKKNYTLEYFTVYYNSLFNGGQDLG
jgi:hypothetical protein